MAAKAAKKEKLPLRLWRTSTEFLGEVRAELTKVVWPSRDEAVSSTWVVIGAVVVVAVWIFVVDQITGIVMTGLIRLFG